MMSNNINSEPIEILLVEDNPGDAELTVEAGTVYTDDGATASDLGSDITASIAKIK